MSVKKQKSKFNLRIVSEFTDYGPKQKRNCSNPFKKKSNNSCITIRDDREINLRKSRT